MSDETAAAKLKLEEDDATRIEPFTDRVAADLEQAAVDRA